MESVILCLWPSYIGGLGFSPHDIGTVLGIASLLLVPMSMIVFVPVSLSCVCGCVPNDSTEEIYTKGCWYQMTQLRKFTQKDFWS